MKHLLAIVGIMILLLAPAVALAQYDYPPSGPPMGGGGTDAGDVGGVPAPDVSTGSGGAPSIDLPVAIGDDSASESADVVIVDFAFRPAFVSVPAGSSVSWQNSGGAPHTVTANDGAFDSGEIAPGGGYSETFADAGVYRYHCTIHPNMMGTIMVSGS